jgi:hypothetical protein
MGDKAKVTDVDAIEAFRATLIVYLGKARPTLEEASAEVLRTRLWLENEQRTYWDKEIRKRTRELEQTQQALFDAKLSNLRDESAAEVLAVRRAKRGVEEAEVKSRVLKHWNRDFESRVQPLVKQMEKLHTLLANDLPKAVAHLGQLVKTLDAYSEGPAPAGGGPTPDSGPQTTNEGKAGHQPSTVNHQPPA